MIVITTFHAYEDSRIAKDKLSRDICIAMTTTKNTVEV